MRGQRASRSVLVVDLESRGGARGILEWQARRIARRLGAGASVGSPPDVLLHLAEGSGPSDGWSGRVRLSRTVDHVSPSRLGEIHERVFAQSVDVVRRLNGTVFPRVCDVGLGELNLVLIQQYLASFEILASALEALVEGSNVTACHVVSADVGFAGALERLVVGRADMVTTWPPRRLLEAARRAKSASSWLWRHDSSKAERAARDAMSDLLRERGLQRTRPRVLIVAESAPMAHMFAVIERALTRAGVGPVLRLDSSRGVAAAERSGAVVCRWPVPGGLGPKWGPLRAEWGEAQRALQSAYAVTALGGAHDAALWEGLVGYLFVSEFDAEARHLWAADTALDLLQPEVVVVGNDRSWGGQAFVQLARRRGIPSVCVQDGVAGDVPFWWWLTADRLAATSERLVRLLVSHGVQPDRCKVTGQPRYDVLVPSGLEDRRAVRATLGLDPSVFVVLFAVQTMHGPDYVRGVISALLAVPGVHVMLRPHPGDRRTVWERLAREQGSTRITLHGGGDSITLARACDVLVTQHSTVAVEGALLGKPVITADFGGPFGADRGVPAGLAISVHSLDELTSEVDRLHRGAPTPHLRDGAAALAEMLGPVDGRAGERVAELVREALEEPCAATDTELSILSHARPVRA
jgi:hypothetical protein